MILGVHYGHNATLALAKEGKIIFCQSEERLNRIKNTIGFPKSTLAYVYKKICKPQDIDLAVLFQRSLLGYLTLKRKKFAPFQSGYFASPIASGSCFYKRSMFNLKRTRTFWHFSQLRNRFFTEKNTRLHLEQMRYFSSELALPIHKVCLMDHHEAHAYSVFGHIQEWDKALVFTLDGVGDYLSGTVNIYKGGLLERIQETNHQNSLGYYYSTITALLGMRAGEHEFKIMGLAPYSSPEYFQPILKKLKKLIWVDNQGQIITRVPPSALFFVLDQITRHQRFDHVAGAIQALVEEIVVQWVGFWMNKTQIKNIALAGGVFMNVKACQKLLEDLPVEKIFVMPSAADESTAIGSAFWGGLQVNPPVRPVPFKDLYLGSEFSDREIEEELSKSNAHSRYQIKKPEDMEKEVAILLAQNEVVARFAGRMEFGARALGNRSILANPSHFETVERINASIKNRDFWMPFTPSILEEDMGRYIIGHEKMFAPYMAITFKTTQLAQKHLKAAIHPRDKTARPQCVPASWNPKFHKIISEFKKISGIGAVLNTSFNLHGEPNVGSPKDAVQTLDNSGLKNLALGPFLLRKK